MALNVTGDDQNTNLALSRRSFSRLSIEARARAIDSIFKSSKAPFSEFQFLLPNQFSQSEVKDFLTYFSSSFRVAQIELRVPSPVGRVQSDVMSLIKPSTMLNGSRFAQSASRNLISLLGSAQVLLRQLKNDRRHMRVDGERGFKIFRSCS